MELNDVRESINALDDTIVRALEKRSLFAKEVARRKREAGNSAIHAPGREASIFRRVLAAGREMGLNLDYLREIFSLIIAHSKEVQCDELGLPTFLNTRPVPPDELRDQLMQLTERTAGTYDTAYCDGDGTDAVKLTLAYEREMIDAFSPSEDGKGLVLDLGCATGEMTMFLAERHAYVRGYDVSPHMIQIAQQRGGIDNVRFEQTDLMERIPVDDNSVHLAVANFGSASEVSDRILAELSRVLMPGGKAFLSFYNRQALSSRWYYPRPSTLSAQHNYHNDTAEVWVEDEVFTVHAKGVDPTTLRDVLLSTKNLFSIDMRTYPTILSILPRFFFASSRFRELVEIAKEIDDSLAERGPYRGTYLMAVVQKS